MPTTWKKAKLGGLPRLLASALDSGAGRGVGDSTLVLQAGFPTSVADLVVKNSGRLKKKAPRWLRRRQAPSPGELEPEPEAGRSTAAPPTEPEQMPGESLKISALEEKAVIVEAVRSASEVVCRPKPEKDLPQARNSRRPASPATVVFLMFVLAIGTKTIALGVSISAFAILLVESMGRRQIPPPKPRHKSEKNSSNTVASAVPVASSGDGRIPIKNTAPFREKNLESMPSVEVAAPVPSLETEPNRRGRKWKKLLRKLVPKKLLRDRKTGAKAEPAPDCSSKEAPDQRAAGEGLLEVEGDRGAGDDGDNNGEKEGEEEGGGGVIEFVVHAHVRDVGSKDAAFVRENVGQHAKGSSRQLVLFLIVLFGLEGGRVSAMMLTVGWCLLVSSAGGLWKSWKVHNR